MDLTRESNLDDVFMHLETRQTTTILFVDKTDFCSTYSGQSWVEHEAQIVEVDQDIVDHFQIGKVPQYRLYVRGSEVECLIGTIPREDLIEAKKRNFGDLIYQKFNARYGAKDGNQKS